MRQIGSLCVCITACVVLFTPVQRVSADPTSDARKAIQAAYDKETQAIAKRDVNGAMAAYSPDYEDIQEDGKVKHIDDSRKSLEMMFKMVKTLKVTQTIQTIKLKGNQAVVTTKVHVVSTIPDPNKQLHTMVVDGAYENTWQKSAKGWLLRKDKTLSSKMSMDGKSAPSH